MFVFLHVIIQLLIMYQWILFQWAIASLIWRIYFGASIYERLSRHFEGKRFSFLRYKVYCWQLISFDTGHRNWVLCIAWSPDGKHLVSGSKAGELQCWDPQTGKPSGGPLTVMSSTLKIFWKAKILPDTLSSFVQASLFDLIFSTNSQEWGCKSKLCHDISGLT